MGRGRKATKAGGSQSEASDDGNTTSGSPVVRARNSPKKENPTEAVTETPEQRKADFEKKKANFFVRTLWTLIMAFGFLAALCAGHIYVIAIITVVQIISFKEVIAIASVPSRMRQLRSTKNLNWYWLATTMYFLYGESVIYYFKHIVLVDKVLLPLATHHRFISFILYVFGFVFFVTTLQAGQYKFQFTQFAWTHMALYLIVVQAHFVMNNVFEGMIWFLLPATLVINNDIWAYICGITFGRTQLIKISPKKTVEGFIGAWIITNLFGLLTAKLMMRSGFFICPVTDLGANVLSGLSCTPNPVFLPKTYSLPQYFFLPPGFTVSFTTEPMMFHTLALSTFASLIAPFGGFFASGLKRTFKIKDFGDSIPGHGGMTDRMDCQFIMGFFAYMYYHSFIASHKANLGNVMETAITGLSIDDQIELVKGMAKHLNNQGIWPSQVLECLSDAIKR